MFRWLTHGPVIAFIVLTGVTVVLLLFAALLQGIELAALTAPGRWLHELEHGLALDTLANAADVVAAVLAIAITVVAIVVELAANRYSHRITRLFLREPTNIVTMSVFVITTLLCVWVSVTLSRSGPDAVLPNAGFAVTMILVTLSLLILLPYFAYVFAFLSPLSVIRKLETSALRYVKSSRRGSAKIAQARAEESIDELQDVARRATELSDNAVAMATIEALDDLLTDYQALRGELPPDWFRLHASVAGDADFVALAGEVLEEIERNGSWLEVKVMRQYLALVNQSIGKARDIAYLIAIHTRRIALMARGSNPPLLELCIRCFNSYLRATINAHDPRTCYYVLDQYRQLASRLMSAGESDRVAEIARHFQFYGLLAYRTEQPFLLEVAAYDLSQLITQSVGEALVLTDPLLDLLLEFDQEVKRDTQVATLIGVRRAQIQLGTLFAERGDAERTRRICEDLKSESPERLWQIQRELMAEDRPQYWEFTDRGVNFSYLPQARRRFLPAVLYWLEQNAGAAATGSTRD